MQEIKLVTAPDAPNPPGPFSHAAVVGDWVHTSGMGGLDPKTGQVVSDDVIEQTVQAILNTERILAAAGCTLQDVSEARVRSEVQSCIASSEGGKVSEVGAVSDVNTAVAPSSRGRL